MAAVRFNFWITETQNEIQISKTIRKNHSNSELLETCMQDNLNRGIESGYYRKDIDVDFICRIHFVGFMGIKDTDLFAPEKYSQPALMDHFLEYHLRAICTTKGLKTLEDLIELNEK